MDYRQNIIQASSSQINASSNGDTMSPQDIVDNKHMSLHDTLYDIAVSKMKADMPEIFNVYKYIITEISSGSVNSAPSVSVSLYTESTAAPSRTVIPLAKWWPEERLGDSKDCGGRVTEEPKCAEQTNMSNCECVYIDYVKSRAIIKDRITQKKRTVKLSDIYSVGVTVVPMSEKMSVTASDDMFSNHYNAGVIL